MEGKKEPSIADQVDYALRITFGVVHAVLLTLGGLGLAYLVPSLSQFLFGLYGCVLAPALSWLLAIFCNGCLQYVAEARVTPHGCLATSWIPPLGVFCLSLIILPLEMMPSLGFTGPLNTLLATSLVGNFILAFVLQIYAVRSNQSSASEGASDPT